MEDVTSVTLCASRRLFKGVLSRNVSLVKCMIGSTVYSRDARSGIKHAQVIDMNDRLSIRKPNNKITVIAGGTEGIMRINKTFD